MVLLAGTTVWPHLVVNSTSPSTNPPSPTTFILVWHTIFEYGFLPLFHFFISFFFLPIFSLCFMLSTLILISQQNAETLMVFVVCFFLHFFFVRLLKLSTGKLEKDNKFHKLLNYFSGNWTIFVLFVFVCWSNKPQADVFIISTTCYSCNQAIG